MMRAIQIVQPGETSQLEWQAVPIPTLREGQVLLKVAYAGVNRADLFQRQGRYDPPPGASDVMGLEVSGTVVVVAESGSGLNVGDAVCALLPGGGYAEYAAVDARHCLPLPSGMGLKESAALPECAATVWMALFDVGALEAGQSVLVHGGASGVGTMAIQMARAMGANVWATVSSEAKAEAVRALGGQPIRYDQQDFVAVMKAATGADCVLDMVGGDYMQRNLSCLRQGGRLISIAFLKGASAPLSMGGLLMKQLSWHGVTLRGRSDEQKSRYMAQLRTWLWPRLESGEIRPVIDSAWPLQEAQYAHERMEKGLHIGKILLQVASLGE